MRFPTSLVLALALAGSIIAGTTATASADEHGARRDEHSRREERVGVRDGRRGHEREFRRRSRWATAASPGYARLR